MNGFRVGVEMKRRLFLSCSVAALMVAGCARRTNLPDRITRIYKGPKADQILVRKSERKMYMLREQRPIAVYDVELGFTPEGHKTQEGDGRTPEGGYIINRRNPKSEFYLSIGISYPNARDVAQARARGVSPGGEIFIHGGPRRRSQLGKADWTAGCIAVSDNEMQEIWQMVDDGTPIWVAA